MDDIDTEAVAKDIEDGTYFVAARRWYSDLFHTPIAERSYYLIVICLAIINSYYGIASFSRIFPLKPVVPFVIYSQDIYEDMPHIVPLTSSSRDDVNAAVMSFMIKNYVINRESYDLSLYELRYRNIMSQSTDAVFAHYRDLMDASNPYSPYRLYTNKAKQIVNILSFTYERHPQMSHAQVVFEDSVVSLDSNEEIGHTRWRADITFDYTDFVVNQQLAEHSAVAEFFGLTPSTAKDSGDNRDVIPMAFTVSDYQTKELLE